MSLPEIDISRAANPLIQQHGEDAEIVAAQRADAMNEQQDLGGYLTWRRIMQAIAALQRPPNGTMH